MVRRPHRFHAQAGFTFIELLLYMAIVSILITGLTLFGVDAISLGQKSSLQQEVIDNSRFASERIKYEIRNASGVNSVSATSISLMNSNASFNPTIIDLSGGKIRIKQGAAATVDLNSNNTVVSSLVFTNYTSADLKTEHIGFSFTMADNLTSVRQEFQVTSMTMQSSAEVRSN